MKREGESTHPLKIARLGLGT
jgi:hypothetical protein